MVVCFLLILGYENCKIYAGAEPTKSVWASLSDDQQLSMFRELLRTAGWAEKLTDENSCFTLMAPTNKAILKLGNAEINELNRTENMDHLRVFLEKHIFPGSLIMDSLIMSETTPPSVGGKSYPVKLIKDKGSIGNAYSLKKPVYAPNGTLFVIDAVLE